MKPMVKMADLRTRYFLDWLRVYEEVCLIEGIVYDSDAAIRIFLDTVAVRLDKEVYSGL